VTNETVVVDWKNPIFRGTSGALPGHKMSDMRITIEKLVYGGMGLGRERGRVVFVPFSVPGDELIVRPVQGKKNYLHADIIDILAPGEGRITPPCPHFMKCGGCHWQQLDYSRQVDVKRRILEDLFHHKFPSTRDISISMKACEQPFSYRSRARVQMRGHGPNTRIGFFRRGSHSIEEVELCPLFRPGLNNALRVIRQHCRDTGEASWPREVDIACSEEDGAWAVAIPGSDPADGITSFPGVIPERAVTLRRKVGACSYTVSASVFFQANDFMVGELAALVAASAGTAGNETALDLYSGVGLFTLPLAHHFRNVISVEGSTPAVRFCSANSAEAGLDNIQAVRADVSDWMESAGGASRFDCIVLDPPRGGAGPGVMERIVEWSPVTILYVSCDPQTLGRDLSRLAPHHYRIDVVEGLDMFPQTYHFETVVRLTRIRQST
jgi:23S rRNA (uracil1939-C5)-methyltransferase